LIAIQLLFLDRMTSALSSLEQGSIVFDSVAK